jgi:adenylate cyclase
MADAGQGDAFERVLLGEVAHLTEEDVVREGGLDSDTTRALWQALGFPYVGPDVVAFTEADVDSIRTSRRLLEQGLVDLERLTFFARIMGQSLSRLADEQVAVMGDVLAADPDLQKLAVSQPELAAEAVAAVWSEILGDIEHLQSYVWRRHLLAAGQRLLASFRHDTAGAPIVVGFADLVGYTEMTREMPVAEVAAVVEAFERRAYDAVVGHGGRIVKTLGDEVMFMADEPVVAAEISLTLAEGEPPVHVGLAYGQALHRGGDLFGPVVNIASRCASIARAGTVVVDRELAAALAEVPSLELRRLPPQKVRGYERLHVSVLRRAGR